MKIICNTICTIFDGKEAVEGIIKYSRHSKSKEGNRTYTHIIKIEIEGHLEEFRFNNRDLRAIAKAKADGTMYSVRYGSIARTFPTLNPKTKSKINGRRGPKGKNSKTVREILDYYDDPSHRKKQNIDASPRTISRYGTENGSIRHIWKEGDEARIDIAWGMYSLVCQGYSLAPLLREQKMDRDSYFRYCSMGKFSAGYSRAAKVKTENQLKGRKY